MPELPEVETIVADLRPHLVGRTIVGCELHFPTIVRHPEPEAFVDSIVGLRIEALRRRGKYILLDLLGQVHPASKMANKFSGDLTAVEVVDDGGVQNPAPGPGIQNQTGAHRWGASTLVAALK